MCACAKGGRRTMAPTKSRLSRSILRPSLSVSIIIATRDRAPALRQTLDSLGRVRIPADCNAEVIVVDNASTDDTATAARSADCPSMKVKYLYAAVKGQNNALNAGLADAQGEIILFTDDDVSVPEDWLEQMIAAFQQSRADAVVGKIVLTQNLLRPWLSGAQKAWLAAPPEDQIDEPPFLIGANMGFRRSVLKHVFAFDPELGPGMLGFHGESLFSMQLVEAGFKIKYAPNAMVVHRPEQFRLKRGEWLNTARKKGRSDAYVRYHWKHDDIQNPRVGWFWYFFKLQLRRILQPPHTLDSEGCPAWEMSYVCHMEMCRQFCVERRRPRNYSLRGLEKRPLRGRSDASLAKDRLRCVIDR
jgi:glucosyl-dolichyl phosphate glucuronosyltransferase